MKHLARTGLLQLLMHSWNTTERQRDATALPLHTKQYYIPLNTLTLHTSTTHDWPLKATVCTCRACGGKDGPTVAKGLCFGSVKCAAAHGRCCHFREFHSTRRRTAGAAAQARRTRLHDAQNNLQRFGGAFFNVKKADRFLVRKLIRISKKRQKASIKNMVCPVR